MLHPPKPFCFKLAIAAVLAVVSGPALAATIWIGNWTLTAPVDVTDFHILLRFEDEKDNRPKPKQLEKGPFADVNAKEHPTKKGMTQIDWVTGIDVFGNNIVLDKGSTIKIGFKIESAYATARKPPVIEEAYWTFNDVKVLDVKSEDLPFTHKGQDPADVPLPATLPFIAVGLGLLAFTGRRRKTA